ALRPAPGLSRIPDPGSRIPSPGLEIAARHVLASYKNLPVLGDPNLDTGDRSSHRTLAGLEGMIQRDDRRSLREPVTLNDSKSEASPELLDFRGKWGWPHHERT